MDGVAIKMSSLGAIIFSTFAFLCFSALLVVAWFGLNEMLIGIFALVGFFSGLAAVAMWGDCA